MAGNYNINILYEGKHIPGSPFRAAVRADLDTRGIRCYGPGLEPSGVYDANATLSLSWRGTFSHTYVNGTLHLSVSVSLYLINGMASFIHSFVRSFIACMIIYCLAWLKRLALIRRSTAHDA